MNLVESIAALKTIEDEVAEAFPSGVRVYPLRPDQIECPAIYNVIDPSQTEPLDTGLDRDTLVVGARCAIFHTDALEQWERLLELADLFRATVDPALRDHTKPLYVARARRLSLAQFSDRFNEVPVFGIEFAIRLQLDSITAP